MEIVIVGDVHGDWGKINTLMNKKNPDIILQCGDFGWWPQWEVKRNTIYHLREKPWTHKGLKLSTNTKVYFCDGNHENHEDLYRESMGMRDVPTELYDNVFYAPRGCIIKLPDGRNVLFVGGADSVDKKSRTVGLDWYEEELINNDDMDYIMSISDRIDIVVSHTCPVEWIPVEKYAKVNDPCRKALSMVLEKFKPDLWYFGHWHVSAKGHYRNTRWYALDYPGHGGRWWMHLNKR